MDSDTDNDDLYENEPKNENIPWTEKYRPSNLDNIYSHEQIITTLRNFIKNRDLPHLLFYGPPGTGKTSTILSCAKELYGKHVDSMVLQINVSEERGIEVVRNKILPFAQSKSFLFNDNNKLFKLIILDEADAMTPDAQAILRRIVEKYTVNARFCLICNYIKKINLALQSRCTIFRFSPIPNDVIDKKIREISKSEGIKINTNAINSIIGKSSGDFRKIINILQTCSMISNTITEDIINKTLGYPKNEELDIIYNSLLKDDIINSHKIITRIKDEEGYSLNDIIKALFKKILDNYNSNNNKKLNTIIQKMAIIEYNLINTTNDSLQLSAFIGLFK
jgi:replication factor C subunit 3/5